MKRAPHGALYLIQKEQYLKTKIGQIPHSPVILKINKVSQCLVNVIGLGSLGPYVDYSDSALETVCKVRLVFMSSTF